MTAEKKKSDPDPETEVEGNDAVANTLTAIANQTKNL